jgi:SAM-dependent methyltransferase
LFLQWNAERLGISFDESKERYLASWFLFKGGHREAAFRDFCDLNHNVFKAFYSDSRIEGYETYRFHGAMHFLRMLSYSTPAWHPNDFLVQELFKKPSVTIVDFGCGLAQRSRSLSEFLKASGVSVHLVLLDIATIRKDFLLWLGSKSGIPTSFLDCSGDNEIPLLPPCDVCFALEFFEHVHDPIQFLNAIHDALRSGGFLETNISDHQKEFMHVSPKLGILRERLRKLGYREIHKNELYQKPLDL